MMMPFIVIRSVTFIMNPVPFSPLDVPVDGTNLIEASAGTGKTYGIAALFARLVVLEQMPVEQILVVTFTKAATAELKTRLRRRLDGILRLLECDEWFADAPDKVSDGLRSHIGQAFPDDGFILPLLEKALAKEPQPRLKLRLKAAVAGFDAASVYTIHGFCQRLLRDYAFYCGAPFDVELDEDGEDRMLVPAQDFWRENVSENKALARLVVDRGLTPQKVLDGIGRFANRPYLVFRRPECGLEQAQAAAQVCWDELRKEGRLAAIETLFWRIRPQLNGNSYKEDTFKNKFAALNGLLENEAVPSEKLAEILVNSKGEGVFSPEFVESKIKKNGVVGDDDKAALALLDNLHAACADVQTAAADCLIRLQLDLLDHLNTALAERKKTQRERSFGDLLLDVYAALTTGAHAEALASAAAGNWQAALIDEFQDTDPLQYEIFRRIFIAHRRALFLVGDPKQAIYSFRGADIYAYLDAARAVDRRYTLAVNYRSWSRVIDGIGALFKRKTRPFVLDGIPYADVSSDPNHRHSRLHPALPAVRIRWLHRDGNDLPNKAEMRQRAADYCADEIAALLNLAAEGRLKHGKEDGAEPLASGGIAVLVRTHNEGAMAAAALKRRGIQSVMLSREPVFASPEAEALAALLAFWLEPQRTGLLRFVLGGVLFGWTAEQIYALNQNDAVLSEWTDAAAEAVETWRGKGIFAAVQAFSARFGLETRLLSDGLERSLTNYLQVLELLAEEDAQSRNPAALLRWLEERVGSPEKRGDASMLRLESDEKLVKIVTMHAAKGLQYPVVFCPFAWDAQEARPQGWNVLHSGGTDGHATELLEAAQLTDAEKKQFADEQAAESLRLYYVALTRAEEHLCIYAGACGETPDNAFAYLLEGGADAEREAVRQAYLDCGDAAGKAAEKAAKSAEGPSENTGKPDKSAAKSAAVAAMLKQNWQRFADDLSAGGSDGGIEFTDEEPEPAVFRAHGGGQTVYRAAGIPPRSFEFVRHTSFTGLSRHVRHAEAEELQPALDAAETVSDAPVPSENPLAETEPDNGIHRFPRGANAGVCLHEILEKLDFSAAADGQTDLIGTTLERYGFENVWLPAVTAAAERVRTAVLSEHPPACASGGRGFALSDVPPHSRLPEMAFTLYMEDFRLEALQNWLADPANGLPPECREAARALAFDDVTGFLNGFIDMVCQTPDGRTVIIDYKSNHLGASAESYTQAAMNDAVAHHHYYLQALIYAVAVARHFKQRRRPLSEISVRYLFLRGLDGSGKGIWQWDIDTEKLAEWV